MASKFELLVDLVHTQLDEDWPENEAKVEKGILGRTKHSDVERVVWVSPGGSIEPADAAGPEQYDVQGATVASNAIQTKALDVVCDIWAEDQERADLILDRIVRAAHRVLTKRSMQAANWRDLTQEEGTAAHVNKGVKYRLFMNFHIPVLDVEEQATVLITSTETEDCYVQVLP